MVMIAAFFFWIVDWALAKIRSSFSPLANRNAHMTDAAPKPAANPRQSVHRPRLLNSRRMSPRILTDQCASRASRTVSSEILVPTEDVVEIRPRPEGHSERKFFPGYVLVKMEMTDDAYHLVRTRRRSTASSAPPAEPSRCRSRSARSRTSSVRWRRASNVRNPPSASTSARPSRSSTGPSPASRARSRASTRTTPACGWRCPSSAVRPRSIWNIIRSRRTLLGPGSTNHFGWIPDKP